MFSLIPEQPRLIVVNLLSALVLKPAMDNLGGKFVANTAPSPSPFQTRRVFRRFIVTGRAKQAHGKNGVRIPFRR